MAAVVTAAGVLLRQLDLVWRFGDAVLQELTDDEALWRPSANAWTVHPVGDGGWRIDWEDPEPADVPPASIAWLLWHIRWWWSTVIDQNAAAGTLRRHDVTWSRTANALTGIAELHQQWLRLLGDSDWLNGAPARWPYSDGRSRVDVAGWVNIELMKNLTEIGQLRQLRRATVTRR